MIFAIKAIFATNCFMPMMDTRLDFHFDADTFDMTISIGANYINLSEKIIG